MTVFRPRSLFVAGALAALVLVPTAAVFAASEPGITGAYVIPAAANAPGQLGTFFRTDLAVTNPYDWRSVQYTIRLIRQNADSSAPIELSYVVAPAEQHLFENVLASEFGYSGVAALLVESSDGAALGVIARTYNEYQGATYGQTENGQSRLADAYELAFTTGLRHSAAEAYRTNVGAVNLSDIPIRLQVDLWDEFGALAGSRLLDLAPWSQTQVGVNTFGGFREFSSGYATWTCLTDSQSVGWLAYASVVDNISGDAVFVEDRYDEPGTRFISEWDLNGSWEGDLRTSWDTGPVIVWIEQDNSRVVMHFYDYDSGVPLFTVEGYEHEGVIDVVGYADNGLCANDLIYGTATVTSSSVTGTLTREGACASGTGTFEIFPDSSARAGRAATGARKGVVDRFTKTPASDPACLPDALAGATTKSRVTRPADRVSPQPQGGVGRR